MKSLPRFRRYVRPYLGTIALGVLFSVIVALATAAVAALLKPMFNDVFFPAQVAIHSVQGAPADVGGDILSRWRQGVMAAMADLGRNLMGYDRSRAWVIIPSLFILAFLVKAFFTFMSSYHLGRVGISVVLDLRRDLYDHIQRQSLRFFADHPTGTLITRLTSDVTLLQTAMGTPLAESVRMTFSMLFLFAVALVLDWKLALTCALVLPLTIYPAVRFSRRLKRSTSTSQSRLAEVADRLQETILGRRVVRSFNNEAFEIRRFGSVLRRLLVADLKALKYISLTPPAIEIVGALAMGCLASFAGWRIAFGGLNPGDFMATLAALYWMYTILKRFARFGNDLTRGAAAAERVFAVLDQEQDVVEIAEARIMPPFRDEIRFRDVAFTYGNEAVLRGLNLVVNRGEKVAVVGASGAGKTTLMNLLPRFYDATAGTVEVDGIDVRRFSLRSLRDQVGLVTQEVVLFSDSVRANIAYGRPDEPLENIVAAAQAANADGFIAALPDGYNTLLGEGGQSLSAGQRQRIAIARALLKDAPILIMDEATSALDSENEGLVQDAVGELMRERTAIIIAHRLATVRAADRIVVLDGGCIVEEGTHDQLLARAGVYARLYQLARNPEESSVG